MPASGTASPLFIVEEAVSALKPYRTNARTHSKRQIGQIAESIRNFGFTNPVLVDRNKRIVAGHGRVQAAKLLGMNRVPTICLESLSEDQIRAYVLADNKLAENAGWDRETLAIELQYLLTIDSPDFDVTITGFEIPEIDSVIAEVNSQSSAEDPVPELDRNEPPVTQPGDLWKLGKHRVLCGNALHESDYRALFASKKAAAVFVDPPFNVRVDGHATGNGSIHHREFAMASGEMSEAEFVSFLTVALRLLALNSTPNSTAYVCMDWRHIADLIAAARQSYKEFVNLCVWTKDAPGMGSFYRSQHELVAVFRKGTGPHRNNIQLGRFGRNRSNVWHYPGIQTMSKQSGEGNLLAIHPTVKPVAMVADVLLDCTARNEIVLDSFLGSGTTLLAAERVGRICYAMEIDPAYVDVAIRRWQTYSGERAIHGVTGRTFDEIATEKEDRHAQR